MKNLIILCVMGLFSFMSKGHTQESSHVAKYAMPRYSVKVNLTNLINPYKRILDFSTDYRIGENLWLEGGIGRYLGSASFAAESGEKYVGWVFTSGIYKLKGRFKYGWYYSKHDIVNSAKYPISRRGGTYEQNMLVDRLVQLHKFQFSLSRNRKFTSKGNLFVESFMRVGFLLSNVKVGLPDDGEFSNSNTWENDNDTDKRYNVGFSIRPSIELGLKIGFAW